MTLLVPLLEPVHDELELVENKLCQVTEQAYPPLGAAMQSLLNSGGKRLRPALTILSSKFNGCADSNAVTAAGASVEMLHTATLVHDDLIDGALLRRGMPTLNASWGFGSTVLAGDYIFAQAAAFAAETRNPRVITLFAETLKTICDGELRQIFGQLNWDQPEDEYYRRIFSKTASLFAAATESGAVLCEAVPVQLEALRDYGKYLGMAFQVVDDILDFMGDQQLMGKPVGNDLRQGILTLPVFYFIRRYPERQENLRELVESDAGDDGVSEAVAIIRESVAIDEARERARTFISQAAESLSILPQVPARAILHDLAAFVVDRHL